MGAMSQKLERSKYKTCCDAGFQKPGLHLVVRITNKWLRTRFSSLLDRLGLSFVVMMISIDLSQETLTIDVFTALKSSLEHRCNHIL